jgi:hypothetical protein
MKIEISINPEIISIKELKCQLETFSTQDSGLTHFKIIEQKIRFRSVDPTIVVAIIGAIGASLAAFTNALVSIAKKTQSRKIVLQSQNGSRLEIPADLKSEEIDMLIDKIQIMDKQKVRIEKPK